MSDLNKAIPKEDAGHAYDVKGSYTDKDQKKAHINVVKNAMNIAYKPFKNMVNPETGQKELHIMMHRGINKGNLAGNKDFTFDNNHVSHNEHGVHTLRPDAAMDYVDKEDPNSGILSFWVPISNVHSMRDYFNRRWKNPNLKVPQENIEHQRKMQDIWNEGAEPEIQQHQSEVELEAGARDSLANDQHAIDQDHVIVKPGKFSRVSEEEMKQMHSRHPERYSLLEGAPSVGSLLDKEHKHLFPKNEVKKTMEENILEPLEKKCPRCGKASANPSNPSGRCSACLKKLAANKKKPGHWQRAQTKADDALRRQKGKNGTAHKKHSGLGSRESIVKQTQAAEKKTGQKLSPDRKDNGKGYAASNTRMVPEKLNRGRHHVDEKKLRAWKKRLKKSEVDSEMFYTLLKAKAFEYGNESLINLVKSLTPETLEQYIDLFDIEEDLIKAAPKIPESPQPTQGLAGEVGKTHTVEIHPDIDHLYRAKGLMLENNKDKLHINEYKKAGYSPHLIDKLPKDSKGYVTPEAIDKHIASLPKKKVNLRVLPGKNRPQEQKHRKEAPEYTLSFDIHPEEQMKMSPKLRKMWDTMKTQQHSWENNDGLTGLNQMGWIRVDPNKHHKTDNGKIGETANGGEVHHVGKSNYIIKHPKGDVHAWYDKDYDHVSSTWHKAETDDGSGFEDEDLKNPTILNHLNEAENIIRNHKQGFEEHPHWHIDEIQSDFQNPKKIERSLSHLQGKKRDIVKNHPDYKSIRDEFDKQTQDESHPLHHEYNTKYDEGKDDWWGNQSMSEHMSRHNDTGSEEEQFKDGTHEQLQNPHFKSALDKLGMKPILHFAGESGYDSSPHREFNDPAWHDEIVQMMQEDGDPDVAAAIPKFNKLSPEERKAVGDYVESYGNHIQDLADDHMSDESSEHAAQHVDNWLDELTADKIAQKDPDFFNQGEISGKDKEDMLTFLSHGHEDPQHALHSAVNALGRKLGIKSMSMDTSEDQSKKSQLNNGYKIPVHQMNTYNKRPKKLGMRTVDKKQILGEHHEDKPDHKIQYMNLHKKILRLKEYMAELKKTEEE